ncbi:MAG TPA: hypothetical protein VF170_13040, partial [Planctomycetaceae bacterium]
MREILRRLLAPIARPLRRREVRQATAAWRRDADDVTARFFDLASATGKPRGLRWTGGAWSGPVRLVRERGSGTLTALVGVVVSFEPVDGGEMEGVEAAALPRDA